jgi:hypothetical protein
MWKPVQEKRKTSAAIINDIESEKLVSIDESGIEMGICKDREWCQKEEKLIGKKSGKHYQRTHMIAGLVHHYPIAPMGFNGSCNTDVFEAWGEELLIKELNPGQVVMMDHAAFHKSI